MILAFCLLKYFPFGGLQRDFLRIAQACFERGHTINVYTLHWEGPIPDWLTLQLIQVTCKQNHTRAAAFVHQLTKQFQKKRPDLVIGFDKMPGLDLYYAADLCYIARLATRPPWQRYLLPLLPRYRLFSTYEQAVFAKGQATHILSISPQQQTLFEEHYQTEAHRFYTLPPGIEENTFSHQVMEQIRQIVRQREQVTAHQYFLLFVGSNFKGKGLDRLLFGLAALPSHLKAPCRLFILGQDNPAPFIRLAKRLNIDQLLCFLGGREDVRDYFLAADLFIHPAYLENTGIVLLEALVTGIPILTVENCGYAHYITQAKGGIVIPIPFIQPHFNHALQFMLDSPDQRIIWRQNSLQFAKQVDLYSLVAKAVTAIEQVGKSQGLGS